MRFPALRRCTIALAVLTVAAGVQADEWRPARGPGGKLTPAIALPEVQPAPVEPRPTTCFSLGSLTVFRRDTEASDNPIRPASGFNRHNPVSSEEQFNCGVITEGPSPPSGGCGAGGGAAGPGLWDRTKDFFGNLFGSTTSAGRSAFQSDHAFDSFISPVSNPFFFEDPRALTEFRPGIIWQKSPSNNPLMRGGNSIIYNFQGRVAFTERWSLVIHRLGFATVDPGDRQPGDPAFAGGTAMGDIQLGPKFTFYRDDRTNTIAALGLNFDIPTGSSKVLQGNSGGVTPYITAGQKLYNFHVLGSTGYRFGFSRDRSDAFFTSLHVDYSIVDRLYPLAELNWYYYTRNGQRTPANYEGADLFNLGSTDVSGKSMLSLALGLRGKINEAFQAGVVYEFPLTGSKDLMQYRLTFDLIFRY
jgi:hypothetical protein